MRILFANSSIKLVSILSICFLNSVKLSVVRLVSRSTRLLRIVFSASGVTCWVASLQACLGSMCDSIIRPSKWRSIACWQRGAMRSRLPEMWLGSQMIGRLGMRLCSSIGMCQCGWFLYNILSQVLNPLWMAPKRRMPALLMRWSAPIQRSRSGLTGFLTRTGMSIPRMASAISWTANGLAVVRAPIQMRSTPCSRASSAFLAVAISVAVSIPVSFLTACNHGNALMPFPSNLPGMVRGFQSPARNILTPLLASRFAVANTCSFVSALHGPAMTNGLFSSKPKRPSFLIPEIMELLLFIVFDLIIGRL